jgi:putative oxidoreductase
MKFIIRAYQVLIRFGFYLVPIILLIIRLAWGWELFESGSGHLNPSNLPAMFQRFTAWGVPLPHLSVYVSAYTEMIGGILLMIGLGARAISIPLFINFCVAYATASQDVVLNFFKQDPANFIDDKAFPFLITSLIMIAFGPGLISIDGLLKHTVFRKHQPSA